MSKKTQKLQTKLYKVLTKYLRHIDNKKKHCLSKPIPDSFLDQLATFRMETGIPTALTKDVPYQKAQKKCNKLNKKVQALDLTPEQWDIVDATITAENVASIGYIRIAYKQGIIDTFSILQEIS